MISDLSSDPGVELVLRRQCLSTGTATNLGVRICLSLDSQDTARHDQTRERLSVRKEYICVVANPVPQEFDWAAIEDAEPIPTPSIPIVNAEAAATTLSVNPSAAAASVSAAVQAAPSDTNLKARGAIDVCTPSSNDTPENFSNNPAFATSANTAGTPTGYQLVYQNKNASSQGVMGYMGYDILTSYDTAKCSANCDKIVGCQSFNIYYERDPAQDPSDSCPNPPSEQVIKCVYYGGPVTSESAINDGQWRKQFHVVIAGSNGYVNNSIATPPGYSPGTFLDKSAIQAPLDCNHADTFMGVKIFTTGTFDAGKCAAACSSQSDYNRRHPAKDGSFKTCQFFNTYVLYNDTTAVGQYCALYNESWPQTFATNNGQWRGSNYFSIGYSYSFANSTGGAYKPKGCTNPPAPVK